MKKNIFTLLMMCMCFVAVNAQKEKSLDTIKISGASTQVAGRLKQVEGTAIYAGKKTEVINLANLNVNTATNNTRQIYARIAGLNIWEYDGGGLQLGIGGRGLNPSRVSNFNTRQNGYDVSADALGYPESYYVPSTEAVERIEIVRGAAGLQYGTQFGGLINFQMKKGPADKKYEIVSRQTGGSWGFFNSFNSIGGTVKKLNYYTFYQYKRGDSWRPNSQYDQHAAYLHLDYALTKKLKVTTEYSFMNYLAQQPGGLADADFYADASQSVRPRNWFKVNWNLINVSLDYEFNSHTKINMRNYALFASREALGILNYIDRPDPGPGPTYLSERDMMSDRYKNFGSEIRLLHQYNLFKKQASTFLLGARLYKGLTKRKQGSTDREESGSEFNFLNGVPNASNYDFPGTNIAVFSENVFQLTEKWSVTPGMRFEYISTKAKGYYGIPSSPYRDAPDFHYIYNYENKTNPRSFAFFGIGTSYKLTTYIELYANISQNYRSINFNDIRVLNKNAKVDSLLQDEKGFTADAGIRGKLKDWLYYDITAFYLKYNDRIGAINIKSPDSLDIYRLRTNIADSRNIGIESLIEADILKAVTHGRSPYKLSVYTNFSVIDARYFNSKNSYVPNDNLVEFVPPVLFRTGISFGKKAYNITWQYSFVGKQYSDATNAESTQHAVDGAVPAYEVMDLSLSYNWKMFSIFGSINNLTNNKYFTRRADGYPGPGILPSDKRGYYVTLQVKL